MAPIRVACLGLPAVMALTAIGLLTARPAVAPAVSRTAVSAYRSWRRVTPRRVDMSIAMAMRCAQLYVANPHENADYHVYVNPIGEEALLRESRPRFPSGSVLVKEKYKHDARDPELLTVMRKRETGFDPQNGDWEYLFQQLPGGELHVPKNVDSCRSCHRKVPSSDYVYRNYTPIYQKQMGDRIRAIRANPDSKAWTAL